MRLEKIKLSGFKSFVDPTTVQFPSNLVGVVGPNGCGKSNVIDAVRWVMGETSAKTLRGESMADVIFNGSTGRKPVGTATIELVFDNSAGTAGGQYASYAQISVKRQLSRDGQSSYFLNGLRCRRRDITDLFLGTGLGPRSYSIIEQGMISRVVEARPEDLRVYLEEAAGISKYKERRRETESRIGSTKENLNRLNDLRDEVGKQLQHLERQAATAEKFRELKEQERRLRAELIVLRWRSLEQDLEGRDRSLAELENRLQASLAAQRRLESEIEQLRDRHATVNDRFNAVQGRFYAAGAELSRLEQAIQFARDARRSRQADLEQADESWEQAREHRHQDELHLAEIASTLAGEAPRLVELHGREQALAGQLAAAEQSLHEWQTEWDVHVQDSAAPSQQAQVERTRINHLEQQEQHAQRRLERLAEERARLAAPELEAEIRTLEGQQAIQESRVAELAEGLEEAQTRIAERRAAAARADEALSHARGRLQTARGRLASLEALQQAALGRQRGGVSKWLREAGLDSAPRLAERLDVEPEWQRAVETVLGVHLEAACAEGIEAPARGLATLAAGSLALVDTSAVVPGDESPADALNRRVGSPWPLGTAMAGVRCVASVDEAFRRRGELRAAESFVTPDGVWLGPNWLRVARGEEGHAGVLAREAEIKQLSAEAGRLEEDAALREARLMEAREAVSEAERGREDAQRVLDAANRQVAETRAALSGRRARAEQIRHRADAVEREVREIEAQLAESRDAATAARERLHAALATVDALAGRREALQGRRDSLRARIDELRGDVLQARNVAHEIALRVESLRASERSLRNNLERMGSQLEQLSQRRDDLRRQLVDGEGPLAEQQEALEAKLAARLAVESELAAARTELDEVDHQLRERERHRSEAEQSAQAERGGLEAARMARQEVSIRAATLAEQFAETGLSRVGVAEALPADAVPEVWQERLDRVVARIQRLGPINLAAIDEFREQSERKAYLDAQHADVTTSLETLENAIRKIDRETRTRFKETFDRVNAGFQAMFPKLFGGGHAYVELVGDELLEAGVAVMARPPGKRNSSIHLLSGGEKALTAVALVFAIFELNPAPFCMLDEVDAPLDDANVGRFCELVKEMAEQVQFIFITHNKVTMEIANQLIGVTMHEPGVSRLVSVDVEQAARLAAV
ncbi:MAG: chromosome segregation protein SMC [Gammaproteobacteria bacterium]|nr:chromosome segregation protein SMC [Gammaproteobacteria bacterium]